LFGLILLNVVPAEVRAQLTEGAGDDGGINLVGNVLLRELSAPVTDDVENFVAERFGVQVDVDIGGFQLQLGRRLQAEGQWLGQTVSSDSATTTTNTTSGNDALRVRLLLFDHMPYAVGRSVSVEGRVGVTSDLRLSYRVFED
jgi:hypothetical protein